MNASTLAPDHNAAPTPRVLPAILAGGLVAGTLDIGAAALINRMDPRVVLRIIAGGIQGRAALAGGASSAWLGLLLQWGMALAIATIFVAAATRLRWLTAHWIGAGLAYGVAIFVVMNYLVLPLSAWHHAARFTPTSFVENLAAMLLFGLIVAFAARRLLAR